MSALLRKIDDLPGGSFHPFGNKNGIEHEIFEGRGFAGVKLSDGNFLIPFELVSLAKVGSIPASIGAEKAFRENPLHPCLLIHCLD